MTTSIGPDLLLKKDGVTQSCEVKSAIEKSEPNCWFTQPIERNRIGDDLVAIVFPCGKIHVDPMATHLAESAPCGNRAVTKLIRKRTWVGAPERNVKIP